MISFVIQKGVRTMKIKLFLLAIFTVLLLSACSNSMAGMDHSKMKSNNSEDKTTSDKLPTTVSTKVLTENEISIVAKEASHQLNSDTNVTAWTFNGSVPGSQIRVTEGEKVKINLKNELPDPVSIHWHGIPVPNSMDGIPGVTQDAVQPGKSFTYEFSASVPGTYMYHTHQDGVNQMDKGLYGSFIIEPKEKTYDKDYTLMLDEWMSNPVEVNSDMEGMDHGSMSSEESDQDMSGMDHSSMNSEEETNKETSSEAMAGHDMSMYDIFTINGKSGNKIEPLKVKEGERVRIRLINVGYMSHQIHLHGHEFTVAATDGQEINEPQTLKDELISIAPGERYDLEFTANNPGEWFLERHGDEEGTDGMKTTIQYEGKAESKDQSNQNEDLAVFNFTNYGANKSSEFTLNQKYDVEYTMDLNTVMNGNDMSYTINGKTFPETDNIKVKEGDLVKVKLVNNSKTDDHPMHLHGHFFQVLSENGKAIEGSPVIKDTINLKPGDEYVVAFKADNPGNWLFHCHDLHHATAGMVNMVKYNGYKSDYQPDKDAKNKPE